MSQQPPLGLKPAGSYRHIIWDWNGTLLADVWLCAEVVSAMLARRNRPPVSCEQYREWFDFPVKAFYERTGFDFAAEAYEAVCLEFNQLYSARAKECELNPEARTALECFRDRQLSQDVLSVLDQESLEEILGRFKLTAYFTRIVGQSNKLALGKLDTGRQLISERRLEQKATLLIGDTAHDHEVASALGIDFVGMAAGHQTRARLSQTGAPVVSGLAELLRFWL